MVHRFEPRAAPRVFVLPAVAVIVIGGSTALMMLGQVLIGVIALAISAWLSYHLVRFTVYQFKSQVKTSDDELVCITSVGVQTKYRQNIANLSHQQENSNKGQQGWENLDKQNRL